MVSQAVHIRYKILTSQKYYVDKRIESQIALLLLLTMSVVLAAIVAVFYLYCRVLYYSTAYNLFYSFKYPWDVIKQFNIERNRSPGRLNNLLQSL